MSEITKDQMLQIAAAGFPMRVRTLFDPAKLELYKMGNVYRLYDPADGFVFMLPTNSILTIEYTPTWVMFGTGNHHYAFNQLAAIREMESLKLIPLRGQEPQAHT